MDYTKRKAQTFQLYKLLVVGFNVDKTVIARHLQDSINPDTTKTNGKSYTRELTVDGASTALLDITDYVDPVQNPDDEVKEIDGMLFVYTSSSRDSYLMLHNLKTIVSRQRNNNLPPSFLVALNTTSDSAVSYKDGKKLAKSWDIPFVALEDNDTSVVNLMSRLVFNVEYVNSGGEVKKMEIKEAEIPQPQALPEEQSSEVTCSPRKEKEDKGENADKEKKITKEKSSKSFIQFFKKKEKEPESPPAPVVKKDLDLHTELRVATISRAIQQERASPVPQETEATDQTEAKEDQQPRIRSVLNPSRRSVMFAVGSDPNISAPTNCVKAAGSPFMLQRSISLKTQQELANSCPDFSAAKKVAAEELKPTSFTPPVTRKATTPVALNSNLPPLKKGNDVTITSTTALSTSPPRSSPASMTSSPLATSPPRNSTMMATSPLATTPPRNSTMMTSSLATSPPRDSTPVMAFTQVKPATAKPVPTIPTSQLQTQQQPSTPQSGLPTNRQLTKQTSNKELLQPLTQTPTVPKETTAFERPTLTKQISNKELLQPLAQQPVQPNLNNNTNTNSGFERPTLTKQISNKELLLPINTTAVQQQQQQPTVTVTPQTARPLPQPTPTPATNSSPTKPLPLPPTNQLQRNRSQTLPTNAVNTPTTFANYTPTPRPRATSNSDPNNNIPTPTPTPNNTPIKDGPTPTHKPLPQPTKKPTTIPTTPRKEASFSVQVTSSPLAGTPKF